MSGPKEKPFEEKLRDFGGKAPLFPLSDVVFYPKTFLPLHIFEPQYRAMIADVEEGDRMVCVVCLKSSPATRDSAQRPSSSQSVKEDNDERNLPIHSVGTLSYIDYIKTHDDGTSEILLVGLTKVTIKEVPTNTPYRMGKLTVLEDAPGDADRNALKNKIFQQFERLAQDERFATFSRFFQRGLDFEMAVNFMAAHMPMEMEEKQKLLELDDISLRAKVLLQFMESEFRSYEGLEELGSLLPGDIRMN